LIFVLILSAGTGGVSLTGLIFAKAAGATTIITSSSDAKLHQIKEKYGVDHTINYRTHPDWASEVKKITGGQGADHILEVGGVGTVEQSLDSVAWGGVVSVIGFLSSLKDDKMPNVTFQTLAKGAILRGILAGSKQQLEEAVKFIGKQNLSVPVDKTFPFNQEGVISAFEFVASGKHVGKVCINLD
jgi:NADPH:quinone reductase-like Zn-dependent oxidoreductase